MVQQPRPPVPPAAGRVAPPAPPARPRPPAVPPPVAPGAAPAAAREGATVAELPTLFSGFDRMVMPETLRAPGVAWMTLFLQETTFRVVGAYLHADTARHWHRNMRDLMERGWGLAPIFLGKSRENYTHRDRVTKRVTVDWPASRAGMTAARGGADARTARELARSAGIVPGSVVWFDNEDTTGVVFQPHELDYYNAFITELTTPGDPATPAFRCGLYAHQAIAAQLLKAHPGLWVWEVDYGSLATDLPTLPRQRRPTAADRRFGLDPEDPHSRIKAFQVLPPRGGGQPWVCWPVWRQWQGDNHVSIPPHAIGAVTPVPFPWDWNSSLVRDPRDPQPTPRLAGPAATGGPTVTGGPDWLVRLDDLDPVFDASRQRVQLPRRGRLTVRTAAGASVEAVPERGYHPHPASEIVVLGLPAGAEIVVLSRFGDLGGTLFDGRACTPVTRFWERDIIPGVRTPYTVAGAVPGPYRHVFWAGEDHGLWCTRRDEPHRWEDHVRAGGGTRLHPQARVAAAALAGRSHVVTVTSDGRLTHLVTGTGGANWPPPSAAPVDTRPVLPAGALALGDTGDGTLLAAAVGTDMRPWVWQLRPADAAPRWRAAGPLGREEDTVHPHTRLGLFRQAPGRMVLSAVRGDGRILRFTLTAASGWSANGGATVDVPPAAGGPHPLTDLPTLPTGRLAFTAVLPGRTDVLLAAPDGRTVTAAP